jgi:hypothetical protein
MSAAAPTPLGVLLSVDPRRTRSPRNPAAAAETELITEAATLVIRQAALAEPGSHIAPERPVTLRLPRSGSYRAGRSAAVSTAGPRSHRPALISGPPFQLDYRTGTGRANDGLFRDSDGQWQ